MPFLNVHTGRVWGTVFDRRTAENFDVAVAMRLQQENVRHARTVFLNLDNGSAHHPNTSPGRLCSLFPNVVTVHLPTHAGRLNQVEVHNSIISRKALRPAAFAGVDEVESRIYAFAQPFGRKIDRPQLETLLNRLADKPGVYRNCLNRNGLNPDGTARGGASQAAPLIVTPGAPRC